jgi:hypothetical protein
MGSYSTLLVPHRLKPNSRATSVAGRIRTFAETRAKTSRSMSSHGYRPPVGLDDRRHGGNTAAKPVWTVAMPKIILDHKPSETPAIGSAAVLPEFPARSAYCEAMHSGAK